MKYFELSKILQWFEKLPYFAGIFNSPRHAEKNQRPRKRQTPGDPPLYPAKPIDSRRDIQRVPEPKVRGRGTGQTFRVQGDIADTGVGERALGPRELRLQRTEEVEKAPGDHGVVVPAHHERHDGAGESQTAQERVDLVPDANAAQPETLADAQLEYAQWNSLHEMNMKNCA